MEEIKRRRLTARRKFEIYLETKTEGAKIGEILRREGIHLNDLRAIEEQVERGALGALKMKGPGRGIRKKIDPVEYDHLNRELKEKDNAMSDLMVEHMLLKKGTNWNQGDASGNAAQGPGKTACAHDGCRRSTQ